MKTTAKTERYKSIAAKYKQAREARSRGDSATANRLVGQAHQMLGYQPNPAAKKGSKAEIKKKIVDKVKKADDKKEALQEVKQEAEELKDASKAASADIKEKAEEAKEAKQEAKADPTAENLEAAAKAEAELEAAKATKDALDENLQLVNDAFKTAKDVTKGLGIPDSPPAASGGGDKPKTTTRSRTTKGNSTMKKTKAFSKAIGHLSAYKKALKNNDEEGAARQLKAIHANGFGVRDGSLYKKGKSEGKSTKGAAKKAAAKSTKKASTKKAASKPAKKKAAAKSTTKKAPKKKAAAKKKGGSRKGPAFPAAAKGGKTVSRAASTTYKKGGRQVTKTVTRVYRENPMGEVGSLLTMLLFGTVGAVASDMLDRWVAIMPERKEGQTEYKLMSGAVAGAAIAAKPNGKRIAAQGALLVLLGALTYYLNKKGKKTGTLITGALFLGAGIRSFLQLVNGYAMPAVFKSSGNAAEPSFGDYMYPSEQEAAQATLDTVIKQALAGHGVLANEQAAPAALPAAQPSALAGIAERLGATAPNAAAVDKRPAAAVIPARVTEVTRALPPASRVGLEQRPTVTSSGAPASLARSPVEVAPKGGKLGCGGPSCGPTCGCQACKAAFGGSPLTALFNGAFSDLPQDSGAANIPTPGGARVSYLAGPKAPVKRNALPHLAAVKVAG